MPANPYEPPQGEHGRPAGQANKVLRAIGRLALLFVIVFGVMIAVALIHSLMLGLSHGHL